MESQWAQTQLPTVEKEKKINERSTLQSTLPGLGGAHKAW